MSVVFKLNQLVWCGLPNVPARLTVYKVSFLPAFLSLWFCLIIYSCTFFYIPFFNKKMVSFCSLLLAATAAVSVFAAPTVMADTKDVVLSPRASTPSAQGTSGGYFYSWWTDGGSDVTYANGGAGLFAVSWKTGGNFVGGKGWKTGSAR